ncbi:hypothetical protein E2542_SST07161 [Spatholobus suberectus]|nr:hypothetical protein E2542_SST07161 [Spatholobus suberectus]
MGNRRDHEPNRAAILWLVHDDQRVQAGHVLRMALLWIETLLTKGMNIYRVEFQGRFIREAMKTPSKGTRHSCVRERMRVVI